MIPTGASNPSSHVYAKGHNAAHTVPATVSVGANSDTSDTGAKRRAFELASRPSGLKHSPMAAIAR